MDNFELLINMVDCHEYMLKCFKEAKKVIYIGCWQIDLTYNFDKNTNDPLYITLLNKCKEGVKIYIITSITPGEYNVSNQNKKILKKIKHPNLNIKILDFENSNVFLSGLSKFFNYFFPKSISFSKCCKRLFHQRYFNVDNKCCMIGGTDLINYVYNNIKYEKYDLIKKKYWIEYGIVFKPKNDFKQFCIDNYKLDGKANINSNYIFGNFYNYNTEYSKIINLIDNSQKSIYIENQLLYSTNKTENEIFKHIADKIIEKIKSKQKFEVTFVSNYHYNKYCSAPYKNITSYISCLIQKYTTSRLLVKSMKYLYTYLKNNNISDKQINEIVSLYIFKKNIFLHNKIYIIDNYFISGTSNLWDRSYTHGNDIEISILLSGKNIKNIKNTLFNTYKNDVEDIKLCKNINLDDFYQTKDILYYMCLILLLLLIIILFIYIVYTNIDYIKKLLFMLF